MKMKIQSMQDLKKEMLSVARGERWAPVDAAQISFESVDAVIRLLTPENRFLLATIDKKKPASVADLAKLVQRAEPNVSCTCSNDDSAVAGLLQESDPSDRIESHFICSCHYLACLLIGITYRQTAGMANYHRARHPSLVQRI